MEIVFINRFFFPDESATSRIISSLAFALAGTGSAVHVVTGRRFHDGKPIPAAEGEIAGVTVHRIWSSAFGCTRLIGRALEYVTFHSSAYWRIRRLAHSRAVVVACTDPPLLSITAVLAIARSEAVLVNSIRDLFPEVAILLGMLDGRGVVARLLCWLRDLSLRKARQNVVLSQRMADALANRGISPSSLTVIHDWSDGKAIRPIDRACNGLLKDWGLKEKFVVGYSGNFGRVHEFATM